MVTISRSNAMGRNDKWNGFWVEHDVSRCWGIGFLIFVITMGSN